MSKNRKYQTKPEVELPSLVKSSWQLYPKPGKDPRMSRLLRPWRVDYHLTYDGGGHHFSEYYRSARTARISAFFHVHIRSWGGTAVLVHQPSERIDD